MPERNTSGKKPSRSKAKTPISSGEIRSATPSINPPMVETVAWAGRSTIYIQNQKAERTLGRIYKRFKPEPIDGNQTRYWSAAKLYLRKSSDGKLLTSAFWKPCNHSFPLTNDRYGPCALILDSALRALMYGAAYEAHKSRSNT